MLFYGFFVFFMVDTPVHNGEALDGVFVSLVFLYNAHGSLVILIQYKRTLAMGVGSMISRLIYLEASNVN